MTEDTDIRSLDENTVARIAAGEVVERPASAVKELVENSLDADATRIDVTIESGGTDLIRVADDGHGMTEADLRAAVRQHTTSKIESVADLEAGLSTLGFRGEALHTIGSVARLSIQSRPHDGAEHGTKLVYEGGAVTSVEPTGCPVGTSVEVTDLFYNTPARRKFLKTTATEFSHVNRVVTRYALANPDTAVSLTHDGREVFGTTGQGDLQAAVLAVYGREVASAMVPVGADDEPKDDTLPPGPLEAVSGLVSHPETNRSSREYLATYVNGRAVTSEAIREGIMAAYDGQLGGDRYPFAVLFLSVPGGAVDVNVHPRKREVRFDDDDAVRRQVEAAVESALLEAGLLRSRAPRGKSAPKETTIAPELSESDTQPAEPSPEGDDKTHAPSPNRESTPTRDRSSSSAPSSNSTSRSNTSTPAPSSESQQRREPATKPPEAVSSSQNDRSTDGKTQAGQSTETAHQHAQSPAAARQDTSPTDAPTVETDGRDTPSPPEASSAPEQATDSTTLEPDRKFVSRGEQQTLDGEAVATEQSFDSLPPLSVLGQLQDTYLVCESPDGLILIDQHAADERVNYERLQAAFADDSTAQALASPVSLELTAAEAETFEYYREALSELGFDAERVDDHTVAVTAVPTVLATTLEPETLRDVLASVVAGDEQAGTETVEALAASLLGDLACYPSITGNTALTDGSVLELLAALDDCHNPYACPHGRPVIIELETDEIAARFERDYPGHGG